LPIQSRFIRHAGNEKSAPLPEFFYRSSYSLHTLITFPALCDSIESKRRYTIKAQALKVLIIGGLIIALMIPILMVKILVKERKSHRNEAISQVEKSWGSKTIITGVFIA
jgi:hypothetical protein